jgi:molybdate transport system ATP-binding protein
VSPRALSAELTIDVGEGAQRFTVTAELALEAGVLVLFGPSGAGKTLTLSAIAGLLRPSRGTLEVQGERLFDAARRIDVPAHRRRIGYVPQHYALFPHRDVLGNVTFGLPWTERRRPPARIHALLDELGLRSLARAAVTSLSGGERQRVALARALAPEPRLILLDEPFNALDEVARLDLGRTLRATLRRYRTPAVLVTHDRREAAELGDELVVFERGRTVRPTRPSGVFTRCAACGALSSPHEAE